MIVTDKNIEDIQLALMLTAGQRRKMVKISKLDFLEHFPILFTHPEFVSDSYEWIYFSFYLIIVNYIWAGIVWFQSAFSKCGLGWIPQTMAKNYNTAIGTGWPCEIEQVLVLLKILPAKAGPKSKSPVIPFNSVTTCFLESLYILDIEAFTKWTRQEHLSSYLSIVSSS